MTMRSTVFKPGSLKIERDLNPEKLDFEKAQSGGCAASPAAAAAGVNIKREPGELVLEPGHGGGLPVVLGNIHNSANPHYHSKSRKLKENNANSNKAGGRTLSGVAGLNKAPGVCLGLGQEENWMSLGGVNNSKQMGGDGAQAKNRNVFVTGQTENNIKTSTAGSPLNSTANINSNPRELGGTEATAGGAGCLELNMEGRWKNAKKNPNHSPTQATCLRQILLLQLDLIEQQQQQLQAKDKEIDELKSEKETLLARMERMERRMQLVKKDNSKERQKLFQPLELEGLGVESEHSEREEPQEGGAENPQLPSPKPTPFGRGGHKRKFGFWNSKTPVKKLTAEFTKARGKTPKFSLLKESEAGGSPFQWELRSKETPEKACAAGRVQGDAPTALKGSPVSPQPQEEPRSSGTEAEELPFMSTTEMYLCRWQQPPPSPRRKTASKKEESVAIPSWREHSVEPLKEVAPPDFIENLDDGVFLKRHAKLELDEKRRKRWDIQRIREQRMFQRLQQRMYKKKGIQESEPEVSSFYPETDDVESLMITPFLPVVAFGRPLPKLTQQNFELPWLDERSRCRIEMQKKQTPHRTCRK
ncbi:male-specific lethal 1 homolog isoform X2 [Polyodon spathula]|uniref:male-specific lethal 1 homolog isoform X2 n=1 Tax=Polyodon spathula TaxID=7913 RepID=UPI001B7ED6BD|nr:male-specific lethal 1 homolog isoform X2 [Polyodon spathula]